ncbi:gasdermin-C isoform X2 [Pteropus medius]|uniref:gasdermin-C isoform X1 n=2 Tax=Pteropus vampyrus TaxID=132908 RepID=UPI00196A237C|nr:gasdermin-C isoform X1 [Pteropus giganteus]XP_039715035.1 gasdermin-C isoform X2 [Pteropus giganteus]
MSSMFIKYSTALVKTIGDEELRPVTCFTHAIKIRQFSILEKSRFLFSESEVPHDISLMDILEPSSSVPDAAVREPFQLSDTATKEEEAGASVMSGADVTTSGEVMEFQGSSFQYQVVPTPNETWTELKKRKLLDPEPVFLRQCGERSINLYVVTETVKLLNSPVLHDISSMKDEGVGEGCKVREMKLTLPQGMVMAYKMKQLVFKEKGWDILRIADEKQKSFPESEWEMQPLLGRAQGFCRLDFRHLQAEVSHYVKKAQLLEKVGNVVFSSILAMLGDGEARRGLKDKIEQEPLGHLDGLGGAILNALREGSYYKSVNSEDPIPYLLGAINVLSDFQQDLLVWSMKKKILLQQRDLVRSILEPNFKYLMDIPFTIKPEFLAPLQGEDLDITYRLLKECGLRMEPNSPRSIWVLNAKKPLSALYAALTVLQQLAEA